MRAITTDQLTKYYGRTMALDGLDLEVPTGEVFAFLGPNGSGKTTTIRLLLDLLRPTSGRAEVLGVDPRRAPDLRRRLGYLPGDLLVDGRQTGRTLIEHLAAVRGGVARSAYEELSERLSLDLDRAIRTLSKGNRQKVGLVQAFMHQPELIILDEPTSGLDPLMQREVNAFIREASDRGQTVFMSSHVLSEVQAVADQVGIIREGRMVAVEDVDDVRRRATRTVEVIFDEPVTADDFRGLTAVRDLHVEDARLTCQLVGRADEFVKAVARHPVVSVLAEEPDLDDLFFDYYRSEDPA